MVDSSDNNPPGENIELTDPYIGTVIADKYEIQELLGGGGAGLVYKARHIYTKKIVAIKLLFPQLALKSDVVKRFQQEAQAASCLNHPGIVSVYDFGLCNLGPPYMVMDYLPGCSLSDLIEKNGPLDPARTITLFTQIAEALQHAHEKGVVHRDLKQPVLHEPRTMPRSKRRRALRYLFPGLQPLRVLTGTTAIYR
jgi:eukaryotic-like serine/threonine-protein kinase